MLSGHEENISQTPQRGVLVDDLKDLSQNAVRSYDIPEKGVLIDDLKDLSPNAVFKPGTEELNKAPQRGILIEDTGVRPQNATLEN